MKTVPTSSTYGKLKVVLLGKRPPPVMGPSLATEILLSSSLKEKTDLIHVSTKAHDSLDTLGTWSYGKVIRNLSAYATMVRVLRAERPDIVLIPISQNSTGFFKDAVFIVISRLMGRPTLLHLRGSEFLTWYQSRSRVVRAFVGHVVSGCQGVIVLGSNLRHLFAGFFAPERIHVVPNGADYPQLGGARQSVAGSKTCILYLGNLQSSKGIMDLVEAVGLLTDRDRTDFEVHVVGAWRDTKTHDAATEKVAHGSLPIVFHGALTGVEKWQSLNTADILVFPPRRPEGHPWVLVEALAAGLPIISTDQGAIIESVREGDNGFIVDPERPEQIADRLEILMDDSSLRIRMGQRSRQLYESGFTEDRMVDLLVKALDFTVSHSRKGSRSDSR